MRVTCCFALSGLLVLAAVGCNGGIGNGDDGGGSGDDRRADNDRGGGDGTGPGPDRTGPGPDRTGPGPDGTGPGPDGTGPDGGPPVDALPGTSPVVAGCAMFPENDEWNLDISGLPVDTDWTSRLAGFVGDVNIHPDFGGPDYGIPINVVPQDQPFVDVSIDDYPDESEPPPYPFPDPSVAQVEGGDPRACSGDCHVLVVQQGACMLYEGYACVYSDQWHCAGAAIWDLNRLSYGQRPMEWTSADAAGLSLVAGLLRLDEVMAGAVNHAIRFTTHCTQNHYVRPATHRAVPPDCDPDDPNAPPMGLRVRLQSGFDGSAFSAETQTVIAALKKHGMILADNGSDFYFQGERNAAWPDTLIEELKQIPASAFEVVQVPPFMP